MSPDTAAEYLLADPARTALCCDFDGTLAPIVDDPGDAVLPAPVGAALARLAGALGAVAVVSGRPAAFLAERVAVPGVWLLGLYGLEEARDAGGVQPHPDVAAWEPAVARARRWLARDLAGVDGVRLEDKGRSVAVHWRHAPDRDAAGRRVGALVAEVAAATGLEPAPGKLVAELRPPVPVDKGAALARVARGYARVAYAGDDLGDLPALTEARRRGGLAIGVDHGAETPPALREACDVVFDGVGALGGWLEELAQAL